MPTVVVPMIYHYRYCDRCRREWPAKHTHCPECVLWLGNQPLERTEWQITPAPGPTPEPGRYELIAASALVLRALGPGPTNDQLARIEALLQELFRCSDRCHVLGVTSHGWLLWSTESARSVFLEMLVFRNALLDTLPAVEHSLGFGTRLRWGLTADIFLLPCSTVGNVPCLSVTMASAIFGLEPDNALLVSKAVFQANRRWENFVGVPARQRDGGNRVAYAPLGRKQPSALDHLRASEPLDFVDRTSELARLEEGWKRSRATSNSVAVIAPPGAGKTRLVRQWLRSHPDANGHYAVFSIFGGDLGDFVAQLVSLPEGTPTGAALLDSSIEQIGRDGVRVLVLDDLHWADQESWRFVRALLARLPKRGVVTVLGSRPAARAKVEALNPATIIDLDALSSADLGRLAHCLSPSPRVAVRAAALARGNPLFVEQFAAWATETDYSGDGPCPDNLHDLIMARIRYLETATLHRLRERITWTPGWMHAELNAEFAAVEAEIGRWLDRLETGDYGDVVRLIDYLVLLRRVEFELFMAANLNGRPRPQSARLREAIERLVLGNGDTLLKEMRCRAERLHGRDDPGLVEQAEWVGRCAVEGLRWTLARACAQLAAKVAPSWQKARLHSHIVEIDRLIGRGVGPEAGVDIVRELDCHPEVDAPRLPEAWYRLGRYYRCRAYYRRALEAAQAMSATGWEGRARAALTAPPAS